MYPHLRSHQVAQILLCYCCNFMRNKWIITGISIAVLVLTARELTLLPDGDLHAYVLDIGQGDSILIVSPSGKQIIIDGGPDLAALEHLGKHMPFFDRSIDLVVLTHPHADHLTALPDVLERYEVKNILIAGSESKNSRYQSFLSVAEEQKIPTIIANPSKDIDLGDGTMLDIIWPPRPQKSLNNSSVVLRILYKDYSILLTGDIEEEVENAILKIGADIRSDILKIAHHGSRTSSSNKFLKEVSPKLALISVGKGNRYGHPSSEVIERLSNKGIEIRTTEDEGALHLSFK